MTLPSFKRLGPVLAMVVLTSTVAFAKNDNARRLNLSHSVSINGAALAAGSYNVSWVSRSPEATVTFLRGKETVATAEAKWVDRGTKYEDNAVVYNTNPDGSQSIVEIRFKGMSRALVFGSSGSES